LLDAPLVISEICLSFLSVEFAPPQIGSPVGRPAGYSVMSAPDDVL